MGQLTDTLRATLRDLAQSDARLYRGLQEELGDTRPATSPAAALLEGDAPASREELERLSVNVLWELCKQRGIKGLSKGPVPKQVDALLSHPDGPPLRSTLPIKATKGGAPGGKGAAKGAAKGAGKGAGKGPDTGKGKGPARGQSPGKGKGGKPAGDKGAGKGKGGKKGKK